ncbi:MAG: cadherin domain-containing protein, partial [Candidatus Poribacteria bacterium]|nr:cadherin domain-containing protein [Candidatus Poribacteria bacterium]
MKFAKVLLIASFSICMLIGLTPRAMSRNAIPGQGSGTSKDPSANTTIRDKALDGLIILYGTSENANTSIPPPPMHQLNRNGNFLVTGESQFIVTYEGFTDEAREAFQYAVDIWNSLIRSPVPIRIDASFTDFGGFEDGAIILGGARPAGWKSPGSLDLWFPEALADKRAGRDLADNEPDIITRFNSHEEANWYFGTDGNTPVGKTDFVSTVLHEIAHGLGFFSFARVEEGSIRTFSSSIGRGKLRGSTPKLPYIYDFFVENGAGTTLLSFPDPSFALENQITSNDLFWNGKKGTEANGGILPHLYAPSSWEEGSSYTHLDEITFPAGTPNSLMTPHHDYQEAIHNPGPITLGMLEDMGWIINKAPMFTDGSSTTRTMVNKSIRNPVAAADADNDALTYQLSGTDAAAFDIDSATGQLKTKAAHTYNKVSYTVTVTVSDGTLIDEIAVTIHVSGTTTETPTNSSPSFVDGSHTNRTVAENTAKGVNIGNPITATDADNDALTYTLSGPDAASFEIDNTTGQLKTKANLDYETKNAYTVTVTVSDGSLTITITVIIIIIDLDDQESPTLTLTSQPLTETTLNGSIVTLSVNNRVYENWLSDPVTVSGIPGVTVRPFDVTRLNDTELSVQLTFYGTDLDTDATLTFTVKADAIANYDGPDLTATAQVTAAVESIVASTKAPLTEAVLNGSVVTLTLQGGVYESQYTVGNSVTVSGITGVTVNRFNVERLSDTQVNVELIFDGTDFDTDATLTITVGTDAVTGYNGTALTAQLPVSAVVEALPIITAYTPQFLTEATLNESIVTLTLSSGVYTQSSADLSSAVQVSGIAGVTFLQSDVVRVSATKVTLKLIFDGPDFDTDATLTFTVGADAITEYDGPVLITSIPITAVVEENPTIAVFATQPLTEATLNGNIIRLTLNNGTYARVNFDTAVKVSGIAGVTIGIFGVERVSDTDIIFQLEFNGNLDTNVTLTFTVEADAITEYEGPALIAQLPVNGGKESVVASTVAPLTETTLNGKVVTLTLNGATYERSTYDLRDAVSISGIEGVTFHWFDLDRVSDTALTVELTFKGNIDTDATLTFTVGADAIADYNGTPLIAQVTVTGGKESVTASSEAPLTETTLDDSIVTLTLTGRNYARSSYDIEQAVTIAGIEGVTVYDVDRISNTKITVELRFNGDFDTDTTLTFIVGTNALLRYSGPALTAQLPVTGGHESIAAATDAPLTETTLDDSIITLTLTGRNYARSSYDIEQAVTIDGIQGATIYDVDRINNTTITVELTFNGDFDTEAILTLTIGPNAIANYNGPAFTAQVAVSGGHESIAASTEAPLTEATLDDSVVTLTLTGRNYARSSYDIEQAVT